MTPRLLALALTLACLSGCAEKPSSSGASQTDNPTPEASGGFDGRAWIAAAGEAATDLREVDPDDERVEAAKALADELSAVVDWERACDTYLDYQTGEPVYEPTEDEAASWVRGTLDLGLISDSEAVAAITCDYGAYQGAYALVHVREDGATLLQARALGEKGQPLPRTLGTFSTPDWSDLGSGVVRTVGLARGLGDCGQLVTFALPASGDLLEIREVRARDCGDDIPDPLPPPTEWPVVYSSE